MTARRPISEKIMAVAGTFNALAGELEGRIELADPRVQSALLNASALLVMSSDTKEFAVTLDPIRLDNLDGTSRMTVTDYYQQEHDDPGDHFAYPAYEEGPG
jgi:hypothetical protein